MATQLKEVGGGVPTGLALLREPFAPHHISKLPKPTKSQTDAVKANFKAGIRCKLCGSWHHPDVVHLDYVGHAALTDRLLDVDPEWSWEPLATTELGLPAFDQTGGLWIKLTVCGVTRLGYGHAAAKNTDPGAREKEVIGDALRNAAMRFGAALDLWHKGDLHPEEPEDKPAFIEPAKQAAHEELQQQLEQSVEQVKHDARKDPWGKFYSGKAALHKGLNAHAAELRRIGDEGVFDDLEAYLTSPEYVEFVKIAGEHAPHYLEGGPPAPEEFIGIFVLEQRARDLIALRGNQPAEREPA
jgi:hypothetical protein